MHPQASSAHSACEALAGGQSPADLSHAEPCLLTRRKVVLTSLLATLVMLSPSWALVAPRLLASEWRFLQIIRAEASLTLLVIQVGTLFISILSGLVAYELGGAIAAIGWKRPHDSRAGTVLALGLGIVAGLGGLALSFWALFALSA